ncbi:MAG: SdrD B-like domain-containing protein, partial [Cyanobacteria bacterium P01_F01_bin.150]
MTNQLQSLGNLLPQQVTVTAVQRNISQGQNPANTESGIPFGSPSFFDLNISDDSGILDGSFDSYCIDFDRFLNFEGFDFNGDGDTSDNGITLPTVGGAPFDELAPVDFSASVYSSYDDAVLNDGLGGLIEKPQNLGMVNWLINNQDIFLSQGFSVGDIQTAIWALVDLQDSELVGGNVPLTQFDRDYFTDMFGGFSDANVANIVAEAQNYADFVPQAGQKVAVILVPDGNTTGDPDTDTDPDGHPDGVPDGQIIIAAVELAKLGDKVFEDLNANGIQDDNDPGIAGATVNLLADLDGDGVIEDGEVVDSTTTDANGNYHFTVLPGDYKVEFETPDGFDMASPANQGSDDAKDSDGPISDVVSLDAGESDLTIDSGFFKKPLGTIGDRVWFDTDGDGNQDAGEDGINGVTVKLIDKNTGNVVDTQTTSGDGGYLFDGVSAGD